MEVQVRDNGKLTFYESVSDALAAYPDMDFDKISFDDEEGMHRYIPKLKKERWNPKSEAKMNQISTYKNAAPNDLFMVDQPMDKFTNLIEQKTIREMFLYLTKAGKDMPEEMKKYSSLPDLDEDDCYAGSITNVLTIKEFEEKYNSK